MPLDPGVVAALLDEGLAAVRAAGVEATSLFRTRLAVTDKAGADQAFDPVTDADRRLEARVRAALLAAHPGHGIVGEEHGATGDGPVVWVIDPIDGTRAFMSGMPTWGTLLGLVVDGDPVAGLVHQPYTDETWLADPARGARFVHGGHEQAVTTRGDATLGDAVLYTTHPSMLSEAGLLDAYEQLTARCRLQRFGGDCYAFALLAHGCIDLVVEASLKPYDIVPLIPLVERAGGVVTDLEGRRPLQGGTVVAAASPALHSAAVAVLRGEQ
jgi:myo-inositol-1(or 4)-monophosphatase